MKLAENIILNTDSYKPSHWLQYPPNTKRVFSYIESRGGKFTVTLFFGLQMFLKEYLSKPVTMEMIDQAEAFLKAHGEPFNRSGWEYIVKKHGGRLPLEIKAVPEGMIVPTKNVLVTVENTDPECFWLTSYIETALLRAVWYPTTVATISWHCKQIIKHYLELTGDPSLINFKLHDFGARGVSSLESAAIGGAAHLVNFMGSDTISGVLALMEYYNATSMPAFSIPAAEHSSITSWGKENEVEAYRNMIKQFAKPGALFAVVSDSYDIYKACELWGTVLKDEVLASEAILVVRPDSGKPSEVVLKCVQILEQYFGAEYNIKGYKVLKNVRVIQGDGINIVSLAEILRVLEANQYSTDNIAFGMGGGLLQQLDRDTLEWAMKTCAALIDKTWVDVYKDPVTSQMKKSKRGRVTLIRKAGKLDTVRVEDVGAHEKILRSVWRNGDLLIDLHIDDIRALSNT